jgi:hypothetical protein
MTQVYIETINYCCVANAFVCHYVCRLVCLPSGINTLLPPLSPPFPHLLLPPPSFYNLSSLYNSYISSPILRIFNNHPLPLKALFSKEVVDEKTRPLRRGPGITKSSALHAIKYAGPQQWRTSRNTTRDMTRIVCASLSDEHERDSD